MSVQVCPGCLGQNSPQAQTCEWCGRPFHGRPAGFGFRWWHLVTALLFGAVVLAMAALVVLTSSSRLDFRPPPAPTPVVLASPTALPTRAATAGITLATPKPAVSPTTAPTPLPPPAPTAEPSRFVRIANTGGLGVFLREQPGPQSNRIQPAIPEGALLRLLGQEQTVQAQVWQLCEHEGRGVQGWVSAQFLQAVEITPTPGRP